MPVLGSMTAFGLVALVDGSDDGGEDEERKGRDRGEPAPQRPRPPARQLKLMGLVPVAERRR